MKWFFGFILGILITLGTATSVLANGDDVHLGELHLPMVAVWIGGGLIITVFLLLLISWLVSRRGR